MPCTAGARHPDLHPNSISVCMEATDDDASAGYNDFYKGIVEADEMCIRDRHHAGHIQKEHRVRQCAARARLRNGFGAHSRGVRHAVVQVVHQLIRLSLIHI